MSISKFLVFQLYTHIDHVFTDSNHRRYTLQISTSYVDLNQWSHDRYTYSKKTSELRWFKFREWVSEIEFCSFRFKSFSHNELSWYSQRRNLRRTSSEHGASDGCPFQRPSSYSKLKVIIHVAKSRILFGAHSSASSLNAHSATLSPSNKGRTPLSDEMPAAEYFPEPKRISLIALQTN